MTVEIEKLREEANVMRTVANEAQDIAIMWPIKRFIDRAVILDTVAHRIEHELSDVEAKAPGAEA